MPRDVGLRPLLEAQLNLVTRPQALAAGLTRRAIEYRLARGEWRKVLPNVYLAQLGPLSRSQAQLAALLYTGDESALDDVDACQSAGLRATRYTSGTVFVVVPSTSAARTAEFVRVRRVDKPFLSLWSTHGRRLLEPAAALVALSRRLGDEAAVLAAFSEAVQRRIVSLRQLAQAHAKGPPRGAKAAAAALDDLGAGVLSAPEGTFRRLAEACPGLPPLVYNRRLRLPSGRIVVPDALCVSSGLVHETNGRGPHSREDRFDSMQERHDAMTASGLVVLHNSPRRLRLAGAACLAEFLTCHRRLDGRGLPPGVALLD